MTPQTPSERHILETMIACYNSESRSAAYWKACDHPQWHQYADTAAVLLDIVTGLFDAGILTFAFDSETDRGVRFTWKRLTWA